MEVCRILYGIVPDEAANSFATYAERAAVPGAALDYMPSLDRQIDRLRLLETLLLSKLPVNDRRFASRC